MEVEKKLFAFYGFFAIWQHSFEMAIVTSCLYAWYPREGKFATNKIECTDICEQFVI